MVILSHYQKQDKGVSTSVRRWLVAAVSLRVQDSTTKGACEMLRHGYIPWIGSHNSIGGRLQNSGGLGRVNRCRRGIESHGREEEEEEGDENRFQLVLSF